MMISLTATHTLVLMQVFKWFFQEENLEHLSDMYQLAQRNDPASNAEMRNRIMEAYRLSSITPPQAKFALQAVALRTWTATRSTYRWAMASSSLLQRCTATLSCLTIPSSMLPVARDLSVLVSATRPLSRSSRFRFLPWPSSSSSTPASAWHLPVLLPLSTTLAQRPTRSCRSSLATTGASTPCPSTRRCTSSTRLAEPESLLVCLPVMSRCLSNCLVIAVLVTIHVRSALQFRSLTQSIFLLHSCVPLRITASTCDSMRVYCTRKATHKCWY